MKERLSQELLGLFHPEGILDNFEIVSYEKRANGKGICDKQLVLSLDEKDAISPEYKRFPNKSFGFMETRIIKDYPIRKMLVSLKVRRRRCEVTITGGKKKISRD